MEFIEAKVVDATHLELSTPISNQLGQIVHVSVVSPAASNESLERSDSDSVGSVDASGGEWTSNKNRRRCHLVDKEIEGTLSAEEQMELAQLQNEMLTHRRLAAPLPLADLRALHQALLQQTRQDK